MAAAYVNDTIGRLSEADQRELARLLEKLGSQMDDELAARGADGAPTVRPSPPAAAGAAS